MSRSTEVVLAVIEYFGRSTKQRSERLLCVHWSVSGLALRCRNRCRILQDTGDRSRCRSRCRDITPARAEVPLALGNSLGQFTRF